MSGVGVNRKAAALLAALASAPPGPVAEVGAVRQNGEVASDGYSTVYLAQSCAVQGRPFYSFDVDPGAVALANRGLTRHGLPPLVQQRDGAEALAELPPLAFLYLDGSDDPEETLAQFQAAYLLPVAVIAVDDANPYEGHCYGKADRLLPFLAGQGWRCELVATEPDYLMLIARRGGEGLA